MNDSPSDTLADVPLLALHGIRKQYPAVLAVDGVSIAFGAGEIHAVLGENGAGKSTLMKIIYGAVRPDAHEMEWLLCLIVHDGLLDAFRNRIHFRRRRCQCKPMYDCTEVL